MASNDLGRVDLDDLQLATSVVTGRWKTTILFWLAIEPHRFGALRRAVRGITEKVLTQQLRELEADAIISRSVESTVPPRVAYALTEHGRTLCAVVETLATRGARHRLHVEAAPARTGAAVRRARRNPR